MPRPLRAVLGALLAGFGPAEQPPSFLPASAGVTLPGETTLLEVAELYAAGTGQALTRDAGVRSQLAARAVLGAAEIPAPELQRAFETLLVEGGLGLRALRFGTRRVIAAEPLEGASLASARFVEPERLDEAARHPAELVATAFPLPDLATWMRARAAARTGELGVALPAPDTGPWNACVLWGAAGRVAEHARAIAGASARPAAPRPARLEGVRVETAAPGRAPGERAPLPRPLADRELVDVVARVDGAYRLGAPPGLDALRLGDLARAYELATWVDVTYRPGTMARLAAAAVETPTAGVVGREELDHLLYATLAAHGFEARPLGPARAGLRVAPAGEWPERRKDGAGTDRVLVDADRLEEWSDLPLTGVDALLAAPSLEPALGAELEGLERLLARCTGDGARLSVVDVDDEPRALLVRGPAGAATTLVRIARVALRATDDGPEAAAVAVPGDARAAAEQVLELLGGGAPVAAADSADGPVLLLAPPGQIPVLRELVLEVAGRR